MECCYDPFIDYDGGFFMVFDNVTVIIIGLILVSVLSLVYGNQDILLMVVSGLLGFLAKDKLPESTGSTVDVGVED